MELSDRCLDDGVVQLHLFPHIAVVVVARRAIASMPFREDRQMQLQC